MIGELIAFSHDDWDKDMYDVHEAIFSEMLNRGERKKTRLMFQDDGDLLLVGNFSRHAESVSICSSRSGEASSCLIHRSSLSSKQIMTGDENVIYLNYS